MPLIQEADTQRLTLPTSLPGIDEGEWVEVSTLYTAGIRRRALKRALTVSTSAGPSGFNADVDTMGYRQALLEEIIKAWSDPSPVTPANIERLHPEVQDWLAEQYDGLQSVRSEPEKKEPSANSSPPSEPDTIPSPMTSHTSASSAGSESVG